MSRLIAFFLTWLIALPAFSQAGQSVAPALNVRSTNTTLKNNLTVTGLINNNAAVSKIFDQGLTGATTSSTTYTFSIPIGRAGTIKQITASTVVVPAGSTCVLTVTKNNSTNLLSATNFAMTTLTANTATVIPLTTTTANLNFLATDTITITIVTGALTTQATAPSVAIEANLTVPY